MWQSLFCFNYDCYKFEMFQILLLCVAGLKIVYLKFEQNKDLIGICK